MRVRFRPAAVVVLVLVAAFSLLPISAASAATTLTEYVADFEGNPSIPEGWAVSASPQAGYQLVTSPDGTMLRQEVLPTATSEQRSALSFSPPAGGLRYELDAWFFVEQAYKWDMTSSRFVMSFADGKAAGVQLTPNVGTQRGYYRFYTGSGSLNVTNKSVRQGSWHHVKATYDRTASRLTVILDDVTVLASYAVDTGGAAPSRIDLYAAGGFSPANAIVQYLDNVAVRVTQNAGGPPVLSASQSAVIAPEGSSATLVGLVSDPDGDVVSMSASRGGVTNNGDGTWTWSQIVRDGPSAGGPVTITATDGKDGSAEVTFQLIVANVPPAVTLAPTAALDEGGTFSASGSFADPGMDTWSATVDYGDGSGPQPLALGADKTFALSHAYADDGEYRVSVTVRDKDGAVGTAVTNVSVANVAPVVEPLVQASAALPVGLAVDVSAAFSDPGVLDTHSVVWDWGDGTTSAGSVSEANGAGVVSGSHVYIAPGVYDVTVAVTDDGGATGSADVGNVTVIVPDGAITGGGWFQAGVAAKGKARGRDSAAKVTFGFNVKYAKKAVSPSGNAEFQLRGARDRFKATGFDWLLIDGKEAVLSGTGTIDGKGSYGFLLKVLDGRPDLLRLRIWDTASGADVFDSQRGAGDEAEPTTPVRGSIVIHKK